MQRVLCPAIVLLLLAGSPAGADPLTITAGIVVFTDEPGDFSLVGPGFDLSGAWFPRTLSGTFWFDRCVPGCVPGAVVDFGTTTYGVGGPDDLEDRGRATIGGVVHEDVFYSGEWTFHGPSVIAPTTFDEQPLFREGDFAFEGTIFGYPTELRTGMPLFSASLTGSGTARVFFGVDTSNAAGERLTLFDLDYRFESSEPVPEPASVMLIGTGVAVVLRRFKRRRESR